MSKQKSSYSPNDLTRISDLEHVRRRPAMYLGGLERRGRLNLLMIVMDDALVQALADEVKNIWVKVCQDGTWSIANDGKGIPVEKNEKASKAMERNVSVLEAAISRLCYGSFERNRYQGAGGMMGVGLSVANFLSERCIVKVKTPSDIYRIGFRKGCLEEPLSSIKDVWKVDSGTQIEFRPDPEIFGDTFLDEQALRELLPDFASLFAGVVFHFSSEITNTERSFCSPNGAAGFFPERESADGFASRLISAIHGPESGWENGTRFNYKKSEIVFRFSSSEGNKIRAFANGYPATTRSTHAKGFCKGLLKAMRFVGNENGKSLDLVTDTDILANVDAVVSEFQDEFQYHDQEGMTIGNSELERKFEVLAKDALTEQLFSKLHELVDVLDLLSGSTKTG